MVVSNGEGFEVYESGPNTAVENEEKQEKPEVSFIPEEMNKKFPAHVLQVIPKNDGETCKEKYNRLRSEAYLLQEQIIQDNLNTDISTEVCPVDEIKFLVHSLKNTIDNTSSASDLNFDVLRFNSLKERIENLEKSLGVDSMTANETSLQKVVEELKTRVQIMTPGYLNGIFKKIQYLNKQNADSGALDAISSNSKDEKIAINEVSALIQRWDEKCKELGATVESLKVSEGLHHDAERILLKWEKLMNLKQNVDQTLAYHKKAQELTDLRNKERIASFLERIEALKQNSE
ncbi:unnamed protein product [Bursaphelenchus okinawaensis]|uniref:Uncharacterized protein n=1 Tax=Bursaphelenchus okinawaensis TaxID=465554 RepID=A0A811LP24_9BILA|nr:unnamed protein product [Bursaphelenchus okinawaensis]CAG9126854.1 unnamed protein product [Bursaphelenchus okinawaensis]